MITTLKHRFGTLADFCAAHVPLQILHGLVREVLPDGRRLAQELRQHALAAGAHPEVLLLVELLVTFPRSKLYLVMRHVRLLQSQLRILVLSMALAGSDWVEVLLCDPLGLILLSRIASEQLFGVERLE